MENFSEQLCNHLNFQLQRPLYTKMLFPGTQAITFLLCTCANNVNLWTRMQVKLRNMSICLSRIEHSYAYNLHFIRILKTELHCSVTGNGYDCRSIVRKTGKSRNTYRSEGSI